MYRITKTFDFSAAHQLSHLPSTHKCSRVHGHNYRVEVILEAEALDQYGFVLDYGELDSFKQLLNDHFDHRNLNELMFSPEKTTAEFLAFYFFTWVHRRWNQTVEVRVSETANTWASYQGSGGVTLPINDLEIRQKIVFDSPFSEHYQRQAHANIELLQEMIISRYKSLVFYVKELPDQNGKTRYLLIHRRSELVYYGGAAAGTITDVMSKHYHLMPVDLVQAWSQAFVLDPFTLARLPRLSDQSPNDSDPPQVIGEDHA